VNLWSVYILTCNDGSVYVGCSSDIQKRFNRHQKGGVVSTKYRRPVELICTINFKNKYLAFAFEKYLKSGSGRAFLHKRLVCKEELPD